MKENQERDDLFGASVFVTGGCGFIGSAITRELERRGAKIRLLVHNDDIQISKNYNHEKIYGDVRNRELIREAMQGSGYVFHLAAIYRLWTANPRELFDVNVNGTNIVMEEALRSGVKRIIYTSSASTIMQNPGQPNGEAVMVPPENATGHYMLSKIKAEQVIRNLISAQGLPAIIVKPATVLGPGDRRPTPTGQIIYHAVKGNIPAYVDTRLNIAHVNDVAAGHIAALQIGRIGEDYILGGENVSLKSILQEVAKLIGRQAPKLKVNPDLLMPFAYLNESLSQLTNRTPFLTVAGLKFAKTGLVYDISRAKKELNYQPRSADETIRDAVQWFKSSSHS
jgi:dihydroflavonol-4-reductase